MKNWNPATTQGKVKRSDRFWLDWRQPSEGHWPHVRTSLPGRVAGVPYVTVVGGTIEALQRLGWTHGQVVPLQDVEEWAQVTYAGRVGEEPQR